MKSKSIISTVFGLLMLVVISCQIIDAATKVSMDNETIELTDINDDLEEEDLLENENFIPLQKNNYIELDFGNRLLRIHNSLKPLLIFIQVPSPPPELA